MRAQLAAAGAVLALVWPQIGIRAAPAGDRRPDGGNARRDGGGELDPATVAHLVRSHLGEIKKCYEGVLGADPDIAGKMVAIWTIELDGAVGGFQWASDEIHRPEMASCMQSAISAWRFPPPSGGTVEVSFPFVFQTSERAAERAKKADEIARRWLDALRRGDPAAIRQASAFPLLIVGARGCGTIAVARAEDAAAQLSCPLRDRVLRGPSSRIVRVVPPGELPLVVGSYRELDAARARDHVLIIAVVEGDGDVTELLLTERIDRDGHLLVDGAYVGASARK